MTAVRPQANGRGNNFRGRHYHRPVTGRNGDPHLVPAHEAVAAFIQFDFNRLRRDPVSSVAGVFIAVRDGRD